MKKGRTGLIAAGFIVALMLSGQVSVAPAEVGAWNYIGTIGAAKTLQKYRKEDIKAPGFCTFHMLDYQPLRWMAAGLGFGIETMKTDLNADGRVSNDFAVLTGRLMNPAFADSRFMPYLIGGVGVNMKILSPRWGGWKHMMAGVGGRFDLDRTPGGSGIDLQVMYTGLNPDTLEVRAGYSFSFGGPSSVGNGAKAPTVKKSVAASPKPASKQKAAPERITRKTAEDEKTGYEVQKGDSLWKISGSEEAYGKPGRWKRIYEANSDKIKDPNLIQPKQQLVIPQESAD